MTTQTTGVAGDALNSALESLGAGLSSVSSQVSSIVPRIDKLELTTRRQDGRMDAFYTMESGHFRNLVERVKELERLAKEFLEAPMLPITQPTDPPIKIDDKGRITSIDTAAIPKPLAFEVDSVSNGAAGYGRRDTSGYAVETRLEKHVVISELPAHSASFFIAHGEFNYRAPVTEVSFAAKDGTITQIERFPTTERLGDWVAGLLRDLRATQAELASTQRELNRALEQVEAAKQRKLSLVNHGNGHVSIMVKRGQDTSSIAIPLTDLHYRALDAFFKGLS